jgi:hypothetical protein
MYLPAKEKKVSLNPYPSVHLLSQAEAGDSAVLASLGVELVVLCVQRMVWPHSSTVGAAAVNIESDAAHPPWVVSGEAVRLAGLFGDKVIALADPGGGLLQAAYLLACTVAQKNAWSFDTAFADLEASLPDRPDAGSKTDVPPALVSQGQAIWAYGP